MICRFCRTDYVTLYNALIRFGEKGIFLQVCSSCLGRLGISATVQCHFCQATEKCLIHGLTVTYGAQSATVSACRECLNFLELGEDVC